MTVKVSIPMHVGDRSGCQERLQWLILHGFESPDLGIVSYVICAMYVLMAMKKSEASELMAEAALALLSYNAASGLGSSRKRMLFGMVTSLVSAFCHRE